MPKGRIFAPQTERDGVWFEHRNRDPRREPLDRLKSTSTGAMLSAPFTLQKDRENFPPSLPGWQKVAKYNNFKSTNDFSAHDNRHSFQDHGVYLGNGKDTRSLGKRLNTVDLRQHHTATDYLKHNGRVVVDSDFNSQYSVAFRGDGADSAGHKRFPKIHKEPGPGLAKLSTTTVARFKEPDVPFNTPLHVLAVSQEPFPQHNAWKYSYHGLSKCYPPYDPPGAPKPVFSPIRDPHYI